MGNNYFRFKQFNVEQNDVSMRVNTDGVLLGAWCGMPSDEGCRVLDVGSGTGVIALMAAQRLASSGKKRFDVDAVEIDAPSCVQAERNFTSSAWKGKLSVYLCGFQEYVPDSHCKYDLIVSNPPYFNNSLKNPSETKQMARHTDSLPYSDLIAGARALLSANGCLSVILPAEESVLFCDIAVENGFSRTRVCNVFSKEGEDSPKRVMMEFSLSGLEPGQKNTEAPFTESLCIMDSDLQFTTGYRDLTKDFYLKF